MNPDELMDQWRLGLRISHRAHFEAAKYYRGLHLIIAVPALVISTLFGTTAFANLRYSNVEWVKLLLAVLSVLMIILTSLQPFFRFSERSEQHRTAAVQIGEVRRELEQMLHFQNTMPITAAIAEAIRNMWNAIDRQAPLISNRIYNRAQAKITAEESAGRGSSPQANAAVGHQG